MAVKSTIYLVYWASGSGIARDVAIVSGLLGEAGYRVKHVVTRKRKSKVERIYRFLSQLPWLIIRRRLQVHIEQIHREQFRFSRTNVLIPNPELTDEHVFSKLPDLPVVFCKTRYAGQLFGALNLRTVFTGFTSEDHVQDNGAKDFRRFLHVAGASNFKGTRRLVEVWSRNPDWPNLTILRTLQDCYGNPRDPIPRRENIEVIEHWIPEESLRDLQNQCGIHLCPSEMEGFGHYIVEGMAVGSVVVTTDAPPMNELVSPDCGYTVHAVKKGRSYMSDRWEVEANALETCINRILESPEDTLRSMGRRARSRFIEMDAAFRQRFVEAIRSLY